MKSGGVNTIGSRYLVDLYIYIYSPAARLFLVDFSKQ